MSNSENRIKTMDDFFRICGDAKISFEIDRDYTNLESMIKYSQKLESKIQKRDRIIKTLVAIADCICECDRSFTCSLCMLKDSHSFKEWEKEQGK